MGNWQTVTVNGVTPADPIINEGDGPTLIMNTDLTQPVWISDESGMYAGQQNSIDLNPQSTVVVDGKTSLYAIANPGHFVDLHIIPGGMSFFQSTILGFNYIINTHGFFFYSGTPALGNLIGSITNNSGFDGFGNAYLPGNTNYKKITSNDFQAYQTNAGGWNLWTATAAGGPWNLVFNTGLQVDEVGYSLASNVNSAQVVIGETAAALEITPSNAAILVTSGLSTFQGQVTIDASRGSLGGLLTVTQELAAPGNAGILFQGQAAGDRLLRTSVVGDSNGRFIINPAGRHDWGPGNAGQDCTLYRSSANLLASDYLAFDNNGVGEGWNAFSFVNGWTNAAIGINLQYRRVASPANCVQIVGSIVAPAGIVAGQNITAAIPAAYRPANVSGLNCMNGTGPKICNVVMTTGGQLQFQANAAAGDTLVFPAGNFVALTA